MKIENPAIIATHDLVWVQADGKHQPVRIMIGQPYPTGADWACPCALEGVDGRYVDIFGVSSVQALCLAVRMIRLSLQRLIEQGNTLVYPSGSSALTVTDLDAFLG